MPSWRLKLTLALIYMVFAILLTSVGIVISGVIADYGVADTVAAMLEGFKDLSVALISFLLASYVPRFGYKRTLVAGLLGVTLVCILVAAVAGFWVTPVLFAVIGASFALMKTAIYATVGLISRSAAEHTSTMNTLEGIYPVGAVLGPQLFAMMIGQGHWRDTYGVMAVVCALALLLLLTTSFEGHDTSEEAGRAGFGQMLALFRRPLVWLFVGCAWLYVMTEQCFSTWTPRFNEQVFGFTPALASGFLSLHFGGIALGRFLFGYLARRVPWFPMQLAGLVGAFGVVLSVLLLTGPVGTGAPVGTWADIPAGAYVFAVVGFLIGPTYPTICALLLGKTETSQHSAMTGLIIIFSALGGTTGSQLLGFFSEHFSTHDAFFWPLVPLTLLVLLLFPFKRIYDRVSV
jgi:fucose permease